MLKHTLITTIAVFGTAFTSFAQDATEPKILAFEKKTKDSEDQLYVVIEGDFISGTQFAGSEAGTAFGRIFGKVREDGVLHLTFNYEIEGQPGSEEQLMKLGKGEITVAMGELTVHGPNQLVLKDPKGVKFTRVLKQVPLSEPKMESKEAAAVLEPVDAIITKLAGMKCDLSSGVVRIAGDWALYQGFISTPEDKKPADPQIATKIAQLQFQAQLKKDDKGWKVLRSAFESSPGGGYEFPENSDDSQAPWQLFEGINGSGGH